MSIGEQLVRNMPWTCRLEAQLLVASPEIAPSDRRTNLHILIIPSAVPSSCYRFGRATALTSGSQTSPDAARHVKKSLHSGYFSSRDLSLHSGQQGTCWPLPRGIGNFLEPSLGVGSGAVAPKLSPSSCLLALMEECLRI